MGTASIGHPVPDRVKLSFVIFDIQADISVQIPKITNDDLTWYGTGYLIAVLI